MNPLVLLPCPREVPLLRCSIHGPLASRCPPLRVQLRAWCSSAPTRLRPVLPVVRALRGSDGGIQPAPYVHAAAAPADGEVVNRRGAALRLSSLDNQCRDIVPLHPDDPSRAPRHRFPGGSRAFCHPIDRPLIGREASFGAHGPPHRGRYGLAVVRSLGYIGRPGRAHTARSDRPEGRRRNWGPVRQRGEELRPRGGPGSDWNPLTDVQPAGPLPHLGISAPHRLQTGLVKPQRTAYA